MLAIGLAAARLRAARQSSSAYWHRLAAVVIVCGLLATFSGWDWCWAQSRW